MFGNGGFMQSQAEFTREQQNVIFNQQLSKLNNNIVPKGVCPNCNMTIAPQEVHKCTILFFPQQKVFSR